jgi:hypothetical protein
MHETAKGYAECQRHRCISLFTLGGSKFKFSQSESDNGDEEITTATFARHPEMHGALHLRGLYGHDHKEAYKTG